mgnify:FL=1|tara:strand:- start:540 stop:1319 length:780 start_codon:yes stop_codon:yes gene_type:complete
MINDIYSLVLQLDLRNGETKRMNCPNCNGYKTFTATNNMGKLVWNCYKVSCSISGGVRVQLTSEDIKKSLGYAVKELDNADFSMPEYVVPYSGQREVNRFTERYGIDEWELHYDVKDNRAVFPIMDNGYIVDAVGRSLRNSLPKWKKYGNSGLPYSFGCGKVAVIVEDCVSACVVGRGEFVGVAVLGTSLVESHKKYLSQFSTVVVALDPDALPKTIAFSKELRGHVDEVKVLRLTDDLKYQNKVDMENLARIGDTSWN